MPGMVGNRFFHYTLLLLAGGLLLFPNLGLSNLWDVDEGVNAETAREMMETPTWIVPTFNWELRTAKPALLYWLQRISYENFGITEWAARLPSVLMTLLTILVTYELGRSLFNWVTGLLSGLMLATCIEVCKLGHAATPDATLIGFTTLYLYAFWTGHINSRRSWFIPCGIISGLAVLTKGPVGLALPGSIVGVYLLWNHQLRIMLDRRLFWGCVAWTLTAGPWYGLVTAETKGEWLRVFILEENIGRASSTKENHGGIPIVYYLGCVILFFAPWSAWLWPTLRNAWIGTKTGTADENPDRNAYRYLVAWIAVYFVVFSISATKLPNYIAPAYPALAILTARFLQRWASGEAVMSMTLTRTSIAGVFFTGFSVTVGLLIASGVVSIKFTHAKIRIYPGLENWAWIGGIWMLAATAMWYFLRRGQRPASVITLAITTFFSVALLAAFPFNVLDDYKAPRALVEEAKLCQPTRDIRIASLHYYQPSLVFYCQRRVRVMETAEVAAAFLEAPTPSYLVVSGKEWEDSVKLHVRTSYLILARRYDYTRNTEIIVVGNENNQGD